MLTEGEIRALSALHGEQTVSELATNLDRSTAVRKLLSEGLEEWRRKRALDKLAAGTVTFSKAAELAGMSVWDFAQLAKKHDITWVAGDHLESDFEAL